MAKCATRKSSKTATKGSRYTCSVCGLVVRVDNVCGCVDTCDIICCEQQMSPKK